jgi:hypothetical protein
MKKQLSIAALLCAAALTASCTKDGVQDITGVVPAARIKFFNFGVNAPSVNFYANTTKMTAVTSATGAEATTGVAYGGVGAGGFYTGITPGTYTVNGKISAATDKDLAISTIPITVVDGKLYSVYQSGPYSTTAKTVDGFAVEDPIPAIDYTVAYVRFVNAISNSSAMTLYATNTSTSVEYPIGAAVAYKAAGSFTAVPSGIYNLATRVTTANVITRTAVSFSAGRVYTIGSRGDITVTTGTNAPFLDNTLNR